MLRVVLDTNILISACWTPSGNEARVVELALTGAFIPCVSKEVLTEYREVLFRQKFVALRPRAEALLQSLEARSLFVAVTSPVHAASDEDDNRLLECAAGAGARYLVTGNLRHYPAEWGVTRVVNARQFLDVFSS